MKAAWFVDKRWETVQTKLFFFFLYGLFKRKKILCTMCVCFKNYVHDTCKSTKTSGVKAVQKNSYCDVFLWLLRWQNWCALHKSAVPFKELCESVKVEFGGLRAAKQGEVSAFDAYSEKNTTSHEVIPCVWGRPVPSVVLVLFSKYWCLPPT